MDERNFVRFEFKLFLGDILLCNNPMFSEDTVCDLRQGGYLVGKHRVVCIGIFTGDSIHFIYHPQHYEHTEAEAK